MISLAEVWKDIPGYEGRYQVSDMGRVKSLARVVRCADEGKGSRLVPARMVRLSVNSNGYLRAPLRENNITFHRLVHRLVACAFLPKPTARNVVNHKNGDRTDNRLCNLEWVTTSENLRHSIYTLDSGPGYAKKGVVCLTTNVRYASVSEAARATGCDTTTISACCKGKRRQTHGLRWAYAEEVDR